jgi:hypothetical protein
MARLAVFVLVLAAGLVALTGCGAAPPAPPGELAIALTAEPPQPLAGRPATLAIMVARGGEPLTGARVLVVRRMIGVAHPDDDIIFESLEQGGGRYAADTSFVASGSWDVQVIVTPPTGEARTANFAVEVGQP